jgi:hypothetical protein
VVHPAAGPLTVWCGASGDPDLIEDETLAATAFLEAGGALSDLMTRPAAAR